MCSVAQALTFAINFIDIGSTYIVSNISKLVKYIRDALDNTYWFKILSYFTMARFARLGENSPKNRRRKSIWRKICSRIEEWSYLSLLTEYLQFLCLSLATILVSPPHYSLFYCLEFYLTRATKISGHNCECLILSVSSARCKVESFFNVQRISQPMLDRETSNLVLTLGKCSENNKTALNLLPCPLPNQTHAYRHKQTKPTKPCMGYHNRSNISMYSKAWYLSTPQTHGIP